MVDDSSVSNFLSQGFISAPYSIYKGIFKLKPTHLLSIDVNLAVSEPRPYWSLDLNHQNYLRSQLSSYNLEQLSDIIHNQLRDSVQSQMISDRPIGSFLSGGIDSSLITALMQNHSSRNVRTFSIGFAENAYDEAPFCQICF